MERVCLECEHIVHGPTCPQHPNETSLDPRDPGVRDLLVATDDKRRRAHFQRHEIGGTFAGLLVGVAILIVLFIIAGDLRAAIIQIAVMVVGTTMTAGFGIGRRKARRTFRPRYGRFTGEADLPELTEEELEAIQPYNEERAGLFD